MRIRFTLLIGTVFYLMACSTSKKITLSFNEDLINDTLVQTGHLGICIYEPGTQKYWYEYNSEKYFTPASNTKLFTLYAGLKYLPDSIIGAYYKVEHDTMFVLPSGDPTYLHKDFNKQPVHDFLNSSSYPVVIIDEKQNVLPYGKGWAWDDQQENYMPQRSALPACGNMLTLEWIKNNNKSPNEFMYDLAVMSADLPDFSINKRTDTTLEKNTITRASGTNHVEVIVNNKLNAFTQEIPFETFGIGSGTMIYQHSLYHQPSLQQRVVNRNEFTPLYSQKRDTLMKLMMHRSDNFFAEQTLLMVSNKHLGFMSDEKMIDSLLKKDFTSIPQSPRWVDGSGLSRYNLFSPKDFIYIINLLQTNFGKEKIKEILPTGGNGTLKNYFVADSGKVYAKTGSMSNQYSLSGILTTKKNKELIFSVMINNYKGSAALIRKKIEKYIHDIIINN